MNACEKHAFIVSNRLHELTELRHEIATLASSLHKVRQKVYYQRFEAKDEPQAEYVGPPTLFPACPNWLAAQTEGPTSRAALCDCQYCEAQRAARAALRAKLVPKTNSERRDAAEKGKA